MLRGYEWPNQPHVSGRALAAFDAIPGGPNRIAKVRVYHVLSPEGAINVANLVDRGVAVLLRPSSDGDFDDANLARALRTLWSAGVQRIYCQLDNEPNHPERNITDLAGYWGTIANRLRLLRGSDIPPGVRWVSPPLAVGHNEQAWYDLGAQTIAAHDVVGVHVYGQLHDGLAGRSMSLARDLAKRAGRPIVVAEVGDSSGASSDQRAAAMRRYIDLIGPAEAVIGFILPDSTDDWRSHWLNPEEIAGIWPQVGGHPSMTFTITEAPQRVQPGQVVRISGQVHPPVVAEGALITLRYPQRDESTQWGQDAKAVVAVDAAGRFSADLQVGSPNVPWQAETPAYWTGSILVQVFDLTPDAFNAGGQWGATYQETVPVIIGNGPIPPVPTASDAPAPLQPTPLPGPVYAEAVTGRPRPIRSPADDRIWDAAGAIVENARAASDDTLQSAGVQIMEYIRWLKGERDTDPFMKPRR